MAARTAARVMARQQWKKRIAKQAAARRERKERIQLSREAIQFLACGGVFVLLTAAKLFSSDHALPLRQTLGRAMETNVDVQAVFSTLGEAFAGEESAAGRLYQAVFQPGGAALPASGNGGAAGASGADKAGGAPPMDTVHVWTGTLRDGAALETLWAYQALPKDGKSVGTESGGTEGGATGNSGTGSGGTEGGATGNSGTGSGGTEGGAMENSGTESGGTGAAKERTAPPLEKPMLYGGQPLPAGVRMEQAILNFDYAAPLDGTLISAFGYREQPSGGGNRFHYGVDLAAEAGAEIRAFADGLVTAVGESSSYGKYCMVSHGGNCVSIYAHCRRIAVSSGQEVRMGEKIAEVGETGQTAAPCLHFELQQNGIYLNPVYYVA